MLFFIIFQSEHLVRLTIDLLPYPGGQILNRIVHIQTHMFVNPSRLSMYLLWQYREVTGNLEAAVSLFTKVIIDWPTTYSNAKDTEIYTAAKHLIAYALPLVLLYLCDAADLYTTVQLTNLFRIMSLLAKLLECFTGNHEVHGSIAEM